MKVLRCLTAIAVLTTFTSFTQAAYLLEVDTDGADDGVLTFHPGFSLGPGMASVSQSISSNAFGMTGGDSVFGGAPSDPNNYAGDSYIFTHNPSTQPDNLATTPTTDLGEGNTASGRVGGGNGSYDVYATWPFTSSVSGGLTQYDVVAPGDSFSVLINQNDDDELFGSDGRGHVWVYLGSIDYTGGDITVTQFPTVQSSFVSMRAAGLLFERTVPEPGTLTLLGLAVLGMTTKRRR